MNMDVIHRAGHELQQAYQLDSSWTADAESRGMEADSRQALELASTAPTPFMAGYWFARSAALREQEYAQVTRTAFVQSLDC